MGAGVSSIAAGGKTVSAISGLVNANERKLQASPELKSMLLTVIILVKALVYFTSRMSYQIWLFLTLLALCGEGRMEDNDDQLTLFADKMAETFKVQDLIGKCRDPKYVKEVLDVELKSLEENTKKLQESFHVGASPAVR